MEITIVAINCDLPFFDYLKRQLEQSFSASVVLRSMSLPLEAYDDDRGQFNARKLLERLTRERGDKVIGITEKDIYFDGMNFIFGMGNLGGKHCLLSMARLNPAFYKQKDDEKFKERVLKEVFHEVGHMLGLIHCKEKNCVMLFSNSLEEVDRKGKEYCKNCTVKIKK